MPQFLYSDPLGIEEPAVDVSLGSNVRWGNLALSMAADIGDAATSGLDVEDPGGIYSFVGLRAFTVREWAAPSNNQIIGKFAMQDRRVRRGPALRTLGDRVWSIDLVDYNWHLGKTVLIDADAKRPAESPGARIRWLLTRAAHVSLYDFGHVTYPSSPTLEPTDYRGQHPSEVLVDCAVEGGYNFWADYNEAHQRPELFFMDTDSQEYAAGIAISNVLTDVDSATVFAPYEDAELIRSPRKIAYGAFVAYEGGNVYVRKDVTGQQFAKLDQTAPMANVKSAARARRIGTKFVNDNDEEEDKITCKIKVPVAQVNAVRQGQRINVRFSHLPGYESVVSMRVVRRSVSQEEEGGDGYYLIGLELSGPVAQVVVPPTPSACFAVIYQPSNLTWTIGTKVYWGSTGDAPAPGYATQPKVGLLDYITGAHAYPIEGITVTGTGTVDITGELNYAEVQTTNPMTVTTTISKNGSTIATYTESFTSGGYVSGSASLSVTGVAVAPGDTLKVTNSTTNANGMIVPIGAGWTGNQMIVSGSLA